MFFHDSVGDWLAKDFHCLPKAAADVQVPCPQHGGFNAVRPHNGPAKESGLIRETEPIPLGALLAFSGEFRSALPLQSGNIGEAWLVRDLRSGCPKGLGSARFVGDAVISTHSVL